MQTLKQGQRFYRLASGRPKGPAISRRPLASAVAPDTRPSLERRLVSALHRYQLDTPEDAFPSFLETLHCDNLN